MLYSLFIINKAGGLIFNVDLSAAVPKHSGNEYMRLASTFHGLFEISSEVAPLLSNGIEILDADTFRLQCLKTLTGLKFFVLAKPGSTDLDQVLRNIYILYTDYVLKNPFYELDQPIRTALTHPNEAPTLTFDGPETATVLENVPSALPAFTVDDPDVSEDDDGMLSMTIAATYGTVDLASVVGLHFSVGDGIADPVVSFVATLANLRSAISPLTYTSRSQSGADEVVVTVDDQGFTGTGGSLSATLTVPVTVTPVNDAPVVTVPPSLITTEDTAVPLAGLTVTDSDANTGDNVSYSFSARWGNITDSSGVQIDNATYITATFGAVQLLLAGVTYHPAADWNSDLHGPDVITVVVDDLGHSGTGGAKQGIGQ
eukprot:g3860.t1